MSKDKNKESLKGTSPNGFRLILGSYDPDTNFTNDKTLFDRVRPKVGKRPVGKIVVFGTGENC